ncbi:DUF1906 domain-containing protein [Actinacidiphila sp. ITFR-21]|uniref:DUF1906 domain-containing protein n=1 Tax=Actinacidiphila sp. ITFR-21 TaxID=3075199 RepID=UPI00288C4286|nr:DUF1906 domain-containing protein [Streptomyces sp. ITFR-21]WNI16526.1 DUF1906 domain-containing protein [Streptomyces sp. ITFR-21]
MRRKITFIRCVLSVVLAFAGLAPAAVAATAAEPLAPGRPGQSGQPGQPGQPRQWDRAARGRTAVGVVHGGADGRVAGRTFRGEGFDTCQAPDRATMDAWRAGSPYGAAGIYFGGRARACSTQANLTPDWVRRTTEAGWSLLPIYVGSQSPCVTGANKNPYRIDTGNPVAQGISEGEDAIRAAGALGLAPGSALYLDMEAYDVDDTACTTATLRYIQAWDRRVRVGGYLSGYYSSADSGVAHLESARRAGAADLPDAIWYARWGVAASVTKEPSLAADAWTPHARIHQYHGSVTESYGGKKLTIDRDLIDAPVAVVG